MYKVLLVDDEAWILEGLKAMIDWEGEGFTICATAENGILAEEKARQMLAEDELLAQAKQKSNEMVKVAEDRSRELRRAANEYCEDALRRTEEAVSEAYDEIKRSRARFRAAAAGVQQPVAGTGAVAPGGRTVYDAAADEN